MIFGKFPVGQAAGLLLAHTVHFGSRTFVKGRKLSPTDVSALRAKGIVEVSGARLEANDVDENLAANRVAGALSGAHIETGRSLTGRCNLYAKTAGVLMVARDTVDRLNLCSGQVVASTLSPWSIVRQGEAVATVKVIPFAVPQPMVEQCCAIAEHAAAIAIAPFVPHRVALILSETSHTKKRVLEQTADVTRARVEALGSQLALILHCNHEPADLQAVLAQALAAGCDLLLVCGATVTMDVEDIVPSAICAAGGEIEHFGMPVEPGNMLLLARIGNVPVINLPGCGRSARENGFDWVLQRLLAKIPVGAHDLLLMGVGGMIRSVPEASSEAPHIARRTDSGVAAVILAAGRSTRMGKQNKLLIPIDGVPMVAHVANAALASRASQVIVVTGHTAPRIEALLASHGTEFVHNSDYKKGMATSLSAGLQALPPHVNAVLVLLGDMPYVRAEHIDQLISVHIDNPDAICVPKHGGQRGNPVLWPRRCFDQMAQLDGDLGARMLLDEHAEYIRFVDIDSAAILRDIDTEDDLSCVSAS